MSNKPHRIELNDQQRSRIREIEYAYHVRAFGEEMARVNFLPHQERMAYLHDIIDHARSKGVSFEKPAPGYTR